MVGGISRKLFANGIKIQPLRGLSVKIAANAKFHRGPFEGIGKGRLTTVALIRLIAWPTHIDFDNPLVANADAQTANHRAIGKTFIFILPVDKAKGQVEAVLDCPGIHIRNGKGAVSRNDTGFVPDFVVFKG